MRACDYNVYSIQYNTTYAERIDTCGGMDSEPTGKHITTRRTYLCVACDKDFAMVAFRRYHSDDEFLEMTHVGQLNDLVWIQ